MPCQSAPIRQKKPRERNDKVTRQTAPTFRKKETLLQGATVAESERSNALLYRRSVAT